MDSNKIILIEPDFSIQSQKATIIRIFYVLNPLK